MDGERLVVLINVNSGVFISRLQVPENLNYPLLGGKSSLGRSTPPTVWSVKYHATYRKTFDSQKRDCRTRSGGFVCTLSSTRRDRW